LEHSNIEQIKQERWGEVMRPKGKLEKGKVYVVGTYNVPRECKVWTKEEGDYVVLPGSWEVSYEVGSRYLDIDMDGKPLRFMIPHAGHLPYGLKIRGWRPRGGYLVRHHWAGPIDEDDND
jgi:hypothetical protein